MSSTELCMLLECWEANGELHLRLDMNGRLRHFAITLTPAALDALEDTLMGIRFDEEIKADARRRERLEDQ
jgi:hypothetical protein